MVGWGKVGKKKLFGLSLKVKSRLDSYFYVTLFSGLGKDQCIFKNANDAVTNM